MPTLPLPLLQALVVFADSGSVAEAAARLGLTQPALSKQLKALEARFPQRLFAISGKRKILTPFARELAEGLRPGFESLAIAVDRAGRDHADPTRARVRLMARREILDRIGPELSFAGRMFLLEGSHDEILEAVKSRKTDLGVTHEAPDSHEWIARPLFREAFQAVVPRSLSPRPPFERAAEALISIPALAYKEKDPVLEAACRFLGADPGRLLVRRVTAHYSTLARMIEAGVGWSVIPVYFPVSDSRNWIHPLPSRLFHPREFKALYTPETASEPWLKGLLRELMRVLTAKPGDAVHNPRGSRG